jgi:GT2 family glycosyltransferase
LVLDNASLDRTREIASAFFKANPGIQSRLIARNKNNLGAARAEAACLANYPILAFLDADCIAPDNWLQTGFCAISSEQGNLLVLGLGSGNRPPEHRDRFNAALRIKLASPLGHLNAPQARLHRVREEVSHLPTCNVFYFRDRLIKAGNFSPRFSSVCEDLELSLRARALGFRLVYWPGLEVVHAQRPSIFSWARKMFRYGRGQIDVARLFPGHLIGLRAVPLLMLPTLLILTWISASALTFLFSAYLCAVGLYSLALGHSNRELGLVPSIFSLFLVTHFFYATGEVWGVLSQIQQREMEK